MNVNICHGSVSGCHSESLFGEEDSIDRNRPKISKTATIAPTSIENPTFFLI